MTKRQRLAPKGLEAAEGAAAILSGRYADREAAPEPEPPAPAPEPAKHTSTAAAQRPPRGDAEGMTRRTYYLQAADADALEDAVAAIHKTLRGRVPKHHILGAILNDGLARRDAITQRLKDELRAELD